MACMALCAKICSAKSAEALGRGAGWFWVRIGKTGLELVNVRAAPSAGNNSYTSFRCRRGRDHFFVLVGTDERYFWSPKNAPVAVPLPHALQIESRQRRNSRGAGSPV